MMALLLSGGVEFMEGIYRIALAVLIACGLALITVLGLYARSRSKQKSSAYTQTKDS